jgi:hypothetical protein
MSPELAVHMHLYFNYLLILLEETAAVFDGIQRGKLKVPQTR